MTGIHAGIKDGNADSSAIEYGSRSCRRRYTQGRSYCGNCRYLTGEVGASCGRDVTQRLNSSVQRQVTCVAIRRQLLKYANRRFDLDGSELRITGIHMYAVGLQELAEPVKVVGLNNHTDAIARASVLDHFTQVG